MGNTLLSLSDRRARREELAGGKAHNLARLVSKGYPVPPGFIIPTTVFSRFIEGYRHRDAGGGRAGPDASDRTSSGMTGGAGTGPGSGTSSGTSGGARPGPGAGRGPDPSGAGRHHSTPSGPDPDLGGGGDGGSGSGACAPYTASRQAEDIRKFIAVAPFPPGVEREIAHAFRALGGPVAVRSSMVGEDAMRASFSGQLDSFLGVEDEAGVMRAVRACYASAFSPRILAYTRERAGDGPPGSARGLDSHRTADGGGDADHGTGRLRRSRPGGTGDGAGPGGDDRTGPGEMSMAVLVQRMLEPESAGVAFTADPDTGRFVITIEAVRGLGDTLAGGRSRPDRYVIDSHWEIVEESPGDPSRPVLSRKEVQDLARVLKDVSHDMAFPQDIEWALAGGRFQILQTRPITSLQGRRIYSRKLAGDMAPGLIRPLYFTTNILDMTRNVFARVFTAIMGPAAIDYSALARRIRSRLYTDVTLFADLFGRIGLPVNLFEVISRDESAVHQKPQMTGRLLKHMLRLALLAMRYGRIRRQALRFAERHERRLERYRSEDYSGASPATLMSEIRALRADPADTQWFMWTTAVNMSVRRKMLMRFVNRHAPEADSRDLLSGYLGLKSLEPNLEMMEIAAEVRAAAPDIAEIIRTGDARQIRRELFRTEAGRGVLERFDSFISRYGYLSTSGTDFTVAPWVENQDFIWTSIARMASAPPAHRHRDTGRVREEARSRVMRRLNPVRRVMFSMLLRSTLAYLQLRERISFLMSEDAYQMRRIYLALGAHLAAAGKLKSPDGLFYLEFDELADIVEGRLDPASARERVASRRAEMLADAEVEVPDVICGEEAAGLIPGARPGAGRLDGIPGSAGTVRGYARVVHDPSHIGADLGKQDILVVPFMDVGWTPLFASIGGIVAETGGQLSHSAIVAREYGLPAVVGVERATHIVVDGQAITVDGSLGRVYLSHI